MKTLLFAFVVVIYSSAVISTPVQFYRRPQYSGVERPDDDVEIIPRKQENTPSARGPRNPFAFPDFQMPSMPSFPSISNPFGDNDGIEKEIEKLRNRIFSSLPRISDEIFNSTFAGNVFNSSLFGIDKSDVEFFNFNASGFNPGEVQNKTVSDTKIVDGNVIETKETVYSVGGKNNGRVYRMKTVNIHPMEGDKKFTPQTEASPKINGNTESVFNSRATSTTTDLVPEKDVEVVSTNEQQPKPLLSLENINTVNEPAPIVYDLSQDTRVNDLVASPTIDPDSELIDVNVINQNDDRRNYYYST